MKNRILSCVLLVVTLFLFGGCLENNTQFEKKGKILDHYYYRNQQNLLRMQNDDFEIELLPLFSGNNAKTNQLKKIRNLTSHTVDYLASFQSKVVEYVEGGSQEDWLKINGLDNYLKPTEFLFGDDPASPKEGKWTALGLELHLKNFKENMLALLESKHRSFFYCPIDPQDFTYDEDGVQMIESWESVLFYNQPLSNVLVRLSMLQYHVLQTEQIVLLELKRIESY
ncbi:MAG: hypothetical protein ACFB10_08395 [Salibacteraceae bacterium]